MQVQQAKMIKGIHEGGAHTHTYDAKSGTGMRITRIGVTDTRLLHFAEAIEFCRGLKPEEAEKAAVERGLVLQNPSTAEGKTWSAPPQHTNLT